MKELAEGVKDLGLFTKEETLQFAKVFEDSKGRNPLALTWDKILREKIKGHYYQLAHLPKAERDIATVSFISGIIQSLENLLRTPQEFADAVIEIEKAEKEEEKAIKP